MSDESPTNLKSSTTSAATMDMIMKSLKTIEKTTNGNTNVSKTIQTDVNSIKSSQAAIETSLKTQNIKIDANHLQIKQQMQTLELEVSEVKNSQEGIGRMFDKFVKDVDSIKHEFKEIKNDYAEIMDKNELLEHRVAHLHSQIIDMRQQRFNSSVAIHGIANENGENLTNIINKICAHVNFHIPPGGIVKLFRTGHEGKGPIVIEMANLDMKKKMMAARDKKTLWMDEVGLGKTHTQINMNHYLSREVQDILQAPVR